MERSQWARQIVCQVAGRTTISSIIVVLDNNEASYGQFPIDYLLLSDLLSRSTLLLIEKPTNVMGQLHSLHMFIPLSESTADQKKRLGQPT